MNGNINSVRNLSGAPYNPRKISPIQLGKLERSMAEFGDLSGIVFNIRTGRLIGGHQRIRLFDNDWPIKKKKRFDQNGTVANGYIETPYGRWSYREVDWCENKEKAANLAANKHGGEFDMDAVKDLLTELGSNGFDVELTGFEPVELTKIEDEDDGNKPRLADHEFQIIVFCHDENH